MLKIQTATITDFQQNCRLLVDDATNKSVLVDPGGESDYLLSLVAESGTELQSLVLTHSHIDHCGGVAGFLREFDGELPLLGHETEADMRAGIAQQAMMFNMSTADYENCPEPTEYIDDGYVLKIGECEATALFTPGHAPGHLAFFFEK
jgi:glyoxylase-like metal-dependent hydrolase (beta-lactamase superfamily II)